MSSSLPSPTASPCSCSATSEVVALKKRLQRLAEENEELQRDKRSFRDASDEARRTLARLREEVVYLRKRYDVEKEEKEKALERVRKLEAGSAIQKSKPTVDTSVPPTSTPVGLENSSSTAYPSPVEPDVNSQGRPERLDEDTQPPANTLRKRKADDDIQSNSNKRSNAESLERPTTPLTSSTTAVPTPSQPAVSQVAREPTPSAVPPLPSKKGPAVPQQSASNVPDPRLCSKPTGVIVAAPELRGNSSCAQASSPISAPLPTASPPPLPAPSTTSTISPPPYSATVPDPRLRLKQSSPPGASSDVRPTASPSSGARPIPSSILKVTRALIAKVKEAESGGGTALVVQSKNVPMQRQGAHPPNPVMVGQPSTSMAPPPRAVPIKTPPKPQANKKRNKGGKKSKRAARFQAYRDSASANFAAQSMDASDNWHGPPPGQLPLLGQGRPQQVGNAPQHQWYTRPDLSQFAAGMGQLQAGGAGAPGWW